MDRLERRTRRILAPLAALSSLAVFIAAIYAFFIDWEKNSYFLVKNKETIEVLGTLVSSSAFIGALAMAYLRFFAGRIFARRANISIEAFSNQLNADYNLDLVRIKILNTGHISINIKNVLVNCTEIYENLEEKYVRLDNLQCISDHVIDGIDQIVNPNVESCYYLHRKISSKVKATLYEAVIYDKVGNFWTDLVMLNSPN